MHVLKALTWLGLVGSAAWMFYEPGFEPGITFVATICGLIALYIKDRRRAQASNVQDQNVSGRSSGIQAGRDVRIETRRGPGNE